MTYATSDYVKDPKPYFPTMLLCAASTNQNVASDAASNVLAVELGQLSRAFLNLHIGAIALASPATSAATLSMAANDETTAFNEFEALRSDDRTIRRLLVQLRATVEIPYRERLAIRIVQLLDAYKEDMEGRVFSADSFSDLISFLAAAAGLKYPTVTLTRGGDFYLSWKQAKSHVFSVQFLKTKQCRFVIFRPNERNVGQVDQCSGLTTAQSLMSIVRQFNVADWASE